MNKSMLNRQTKVRYIEHTFSTKTSWNHDDQSYVV